MMQTETEGEEEAILESFCSSLGDLTVNSKPLINILTKVASKNVCYANAIVKAVGSQLEKAPTVVLLPLLYLIDSILKNVGGEYISLFSSTLKNCFAKIFAKVDRATRQSMCNLRQTWSEILSSQELSVIDGEVQSLDPSWPSTNSSLNTLQNPFLKILVNPSFLPAPPANKITLEDEEEENLRELLIQQMLKRKLEKEQNFQEPRDDTDKTTCEKDTSNSSLHVDSNQSQADSTTAEKLITTPIKENQNSVAVPVHTDNKAFTKQANGELLQFLTNLISQGNKRLGSKQEDREPSHRYSRKREEHRQDYKDYRKRQKFSKCHGNRVHYGSWKQDVECEYSSWREDKIQKLSGRYQKNLNSPSDLSQEESGLSLAAKNVDNSSASRINKESLQTLQANSCGSSKPSEALHCPLNDAKPDLLHLASPHDQSRSNAVDYWRVTRTRMLDSSQSFENQAASPLLKEKSICSSSDSKSSRLSNSVIEPSDKISFHRKCPLPFPRNTERQGNIVEIRPVREIDYKHGYGAPEKRLCGGLSDDSDGKCMTEIHHFAPQHSVPLPLTVPSQCNDWQVSELVSKPQLMFNNDEKFMKKIAKESWGSKIVTHVECNMMNLPPVNKFPGDQTVEQSINSVSVDSVTRQVHVYTEKTQYSGNLIKGPWFHTGNTSLLHAAKPKRGFAHKGKKKRARTTERLQRQAAKSAKLSNAQFQLNSTGELADCGIITKQTSSVIQSAKTSCVESVLQPCVNVHALFQSLCDVGLLTRQTLHNNNAESSASSKSYEVDFSDPFSLKRKQPGIVELLYNGLQCCSCGERFAGDRTAEYRGHLDWHFIQNHKVKDSKTSLNRNWFGSRKCWTQTEQFPGCRDTVTSEEPDRRESSVPSHDYPRAVVCGVCRERFDEFFNEDQDEWHLKDCLSCKGVPYHPFCFKDCDTSRSAEQLNISKPDDGRNGGCLKARADKDLESNVFSVIAPLNNEHHSQIIELHGNNSPPEQTLAEQPATPKILPSESLLIYHEDVQSTVEEHDTNDMPSDREQVQTISAVQSLHETSLCEQNEIVRNFEQEDHCSSPNLTCDKIKQLMPNELSTTEVEIIQVTDHSSEDNIADDLLLSSLDINGPESDVSILKPKLVGRRLTILPVVLKGSETSNLCCLS